MCISARPSGSKSRMLVHPWLRTTRRHSSWNDARLPSVQRLRLAERLERGDGRVELLVDGAGHRARRLSHSALGHRELEAGILPADEHREAEDGHEGGAHQGDEMTSQSHGHARELKVGRPLGARRRSAGRAMRRVQLRGGARRQPARRTFCTLSRLSRAPTKQMGPCHRSTPSRSRCARRRAAPAGSGAGNRAPSRPRRAAPTRGRRRCGCGATRRPSAVAIARQMVPPNSMRSAPSSRSISTASACVAPVCARAARATASARLARDLAGRRARRRARPPRRPRARSRATMPRRNTFSAPGRWADARGDLPARERLDDARACRCGSSSSASTTPSSVWSSSARMKLPSRLRTSASTGASFAADVVHVGAAHGELGLELRVVRAEAELHAAVGRERPPRPASSVSACDSPMP